MTRRSLLTAGLALVAACTGAAPGVDDTDVVVAEPATANWMAEVFAGHLDAQVGHILLPGSFNSSSYACAAPNGISPNAPGLVSSLWGTDDTGTDNSTRQRVVGWSKTQDRPIAQQLLDGIRSIEINITLKDGELVTWHSIYGVPLDGVLDELVGFAATHPDEAIVLQFGLDFDSATWPLLADAFTKTRAGGKSLCALLYDGPDNAALAPLSDLAAHGRNLVWGATGELRTFLDARGDCPTSNVTLDRRWSLTTTPDGVAAALAASVDSRDPAHLLVNDFAFSLDGSASAGEQASYVLRYGSVREATEALGFAGDFPGRMITQFNGNGNMNVFAGAMYQDTNLIEAVIAENRARLAAAP